ncbi:MAG: DUF5119 domain-containing protein [Mucinivorans sp.]
MRRIYILITMLVCLCSCRYNDLCVEHPHGSLVVNVDWKEVPSNLKLPEGVRLSFYNTTTGEQHTTYRETFGGKVIVPDGEYNMLAYNSDTEMILFSGMDKFETAVAHLDERSRAPFRNSPASRAPSANGIYYDRISSNANERTRSEVTIGQPDRFFATYAVMRCMVTNNANQSKDTMKVMPYSRVLFATVQVKVDGIKNIKECRASLSGVSRSLNLATGEPSEETGTVIFDLEQLDEHNLQQRVCMFGMKNSPDGTPTVEQIQHIVSLEFLLIDNSVITHEIDVSKSINFETIAPEIEIPILVEDIVIPDVEPPGGGFDADLDDWDPEVVVPIKNKK